MRKYIVILLGILLLIVLYGCTPAPVYHGGRNNITGLGKKPEPDFSPSTYKDDTVYKQGMVLEGEASYYGPHFHGKLTANGEIFDMNDLTCAHKSLPFNTILRVTLVSSGKSIDVRVNDRGPYKKKRIIDLSKEAAKRIGMLEQGTGIVRAKIVKLGEK